MEKLKKVLEIEVPQDYEIDKENSTLEKIVFKKVEEKLTYEKVADKLFKYESHYYINDDGDIIKTSIGWRCPNVAPTEYQLQRLLALNMLMNVAHYLNEDWKPNWEDEYQPKFYIYYDNKFKIIRADCSFCVNHGVVYFKSRELAEQAIEILGEETIKLALGVI